jgi:hypothetical protein
MDRKSITVVVVVLLCAAGFAYSQGWFDWSRPGAETQSNTVSTDQALDQDKTNVDAMPVTQETQKPVDSATK